jgi:uncharacterized membrane protein
MSVVFGHYVCFLLRGRRTFQLLGSCHTGNEPLGSKRLHMSEVEAIKQLTEVVRDEEFIITIGWLPWGASMIIVGGLLFMKIAKEIIEQLRSNR